MRTAILTEVKCLSTTTRWTKFVWVSSNLKNWSCQLFNLDLTSANLPTYSLLLLHHHLSKTRTKIRTEICIRDRRQVVGCLKSSGVIIIHCFHHEINIKPSKRNQTVHHYAHPQKPNVLCVGDTYFIVLISLVSISNVSNAWGTNNIPLILIHTFSFNWKMDETVQFYRSTHLLWWVVQDCCYDFTNSPKRLQGFYNALHYCPLYRVGKRQSGNNECCCKQTYCSSRNFASVKTERELLLSVCNELSWIAWECIARGDSENKFYDESIPDCTSNQNDVE